jgi:hypothetical protein
LPLDFLTKLQILNHLCPLFYLQVFLASLLEVVIILPDNTTQLFQYSCDVFMQESL